MDRYKEVYYSINLQNIKQITSKNNIYTIDFKDDYKDINIENEELYKLLDKEIKK